MTNNTITQSLNSALDALYELPDSSNILAFVIPSDSSAYFEEIAPELLDQRLKELVGETSETLHTRGHIAMGCNYKAKVEKQPHNTLGTMAVRMWFSMSDSANGTIVLFGADDQRNITSVEPHKMFDLMELFLYS